MCSLIPIGGSHVSTSHFLGCQHTPHHSSRCCTYSLVTSLGPPSSSSALGEGRSSVHVSETSPGETQTESKTQICHFVIWGKLLCLFKHQFT